MSINWRELKAAFLALQTFPHLNNMRILVRTDNTTSMLHMNKQGGTRSLPLMELATIMEVVSETRNNDPTESCSRSKKYHSRLRISAPIPQKQLDDQSHGVSATEQHGKKRCGFFCRSEHPPAYKICLMATRSGKSYPRRVYHTTGPVCESISQPTLESDQSLPTETNTRTSLPSNNDNTMVANRALVPYRPVLEPLSTTTIRPISHSPGDTHSYVAYDQQFLETRRVKLIGNRYPATELNDNAKNILISQSLADTATNQSYKKG